MPHRNKTTPWKGVRSENIGSLNIPSHILPAFLMLIYRNGAHCSLTGWHNCNIYTTLLNYILVHNTSRPAIGIEAIMYLG